MKFFKGCLIAFAVLLVLFLAGATFVYLKRDAIVSSVTGALNEAAIADNAVAIGLLDDAAAEATTFADFTAAVGSSDLPANVIYVAATQTEPTTNAADLDEGRTIVLQRVEWTNRIHQVFNQIGAASLSTSRGEIPAIIIERTGPWVAIDDYVVYIEEPINANATPTPATE